MIGQASEIENAILRERGCHAQHVGELAQVSRPVMRKQGRPRCRVDPVGRAVFLLDAPKHLVDQPAEILAFAQCRQGYGGCVQAVIEVLAEAALFDQIGEVAVGGPTGPEGGPALTSRRQLPVISFSDKTRNSRLCRPSGMSPISSRNSVPPLASSMRPRLPFWLAPVESAGCIAEQLRLDQVLGNCRAVDGDEIAVAATAVVDGPRQIFLAAACLALDENGDVARCQLGGADLQTVPWRRHHC